MITVKLEPLKQWQCDSCGELIESPKDGWLEWLSDEDHLAYGFKIVHHLPASPYKDRREEGCYHYDRHTRRMDTHLDEFLGEDGLAHLLMFLDVGVVDPDSKGPWVRDIREFVELTRRLATPYYEEARQYWSRAEAEGYFSDANQVSPYLVGTLKKIIEKYGERGDRKVRSV